MAEKVTKKGRLIVRFHPASCAQLISDKQQEKSLMYRFHTTIQHPKK